MSSSIWAAWSPTGMVRLGDDGDCRERARDVVSPKPARGRFSHRVLDDGAHWQQMRVCHMLRRTERCA